MRPLYFIAIVPPPDVAQTMDNIRHQIWQKYESQHALNSPPHLTLIAPVKMNFAAADDLIRKTEALITEHKPFELTGQGVGHFNQHTLYAKVNLSKPLQTLQQDLEHLVKEELNLKTDRPDRKFTPHLTLAFKDLKKKHFIKAYEFLASQQIRLNFEVENIVLLQYSGSRWLICRRFTL